MPRPNPRSLFALATVATRVLDRLVAAGKPVQPAVYRALDDVRRKARGESVTIAQLKAGWLATAKQGETARDWRDELTKRYFWAVSECATVCRMAATAEDHLDLVLRQISYGLVDGDEDDVRAWYGEALAANAALSATAAPPKRVDPEKAATEAKVLARIAKALGKRGALVATRRARHDPRRTGDAAAVRKLLARHKYPVHASVLAFERAFGGLVIPDADADESGLPSGAATIVGSYACLKSRAHGRPGGGRVDLVPVAYTSNDCIVFLDKRGVAHFQDTIEDASAKRFSATGAGAVARLLDAGG